MNMSAPRHGGTGDCKTGGNYAASLYASAQATRNGYDQVLWLDATHRKYVEEVGSMNMFFVYDDKVYTSPLERALFSTALRGVPSLTLVE